MAHQCKVRYIDRTPDEDGVIEPDGEIKEEVFEWAIHVTMTQEGVIVRYLDDNWEEQVRHFNSKDIVTIHSR